MAREMAAMACAAGDCWDGGNDRRHGLAGRRSGGGHGVVSPGVVTVDDAGQPGRNGDCDVDTDRNADAEADTGGAANHDTAGVLLWHAGAGRWDVVRSKESHASRLADRAGGETAVDLRDCGGGDRIGGAAILADELHMGRAIVGDIAKFLTGPLDPSSLREHERRQIVTIGGLHD